jgi:5-methyltetrahydropteroyltriglutamate--homocysteine methyltransferase
LLPSLFELRTGNFQIALTSEPDRRHARILHKYWKPNQRIFVGVLAPIDQHMETPGEARDRSFELRKDWRWCQEDG